MQAINARIANVKNVCRRRLDNERAQRANVALVLIVAILAVLRLRMQPRVGGGEHALHRFFDRPRLGRAVVIVQQTGDRKLAGDLAHVTAADAISQRNGDTLRAELRLFGHGNTVEVLIDFLAPLVGVLPDGDF